MHPCASAMEPNITKTVAEVPERAVRHDRWQKHCYRPPVIHPLLLAALYVPFRLKSPNE